MQVEDSSALPLLFKLHPSFMCSPLVPHGSFSRHWKNCGYPIQRVSNGESQIFHTALLRGKTLHLVCFTAHWAQFNLLPLETALWWPLCPAQDNKRLQSALSVYVISPKPNYIHTEHPLWGYESQHATHPSLEMTFTLVGVTFSIINPAVKWIRSSLRERKVPWCLPHRSVFTSLK